MTDIWDEEEPNMMTGEELCPKLFNAKNPAPFKRVFANKDYVVLKT